MRNMLLIVNPVAGAKTSVTYLADAVRAFNAGGYEVSVFVTGAKGDGEYYAAAMTGPGCRYDRVCAIGGDGTLNEVVSGMVRAECTLPFGYIPAGSTNDFAMTHHLNTNLQAACRSILGDIYEPVDLGRIGGRCFTYVAAFGAFTNLTYTTSQQLKNAIGYSAYIFDGMRELTKISPKHIRFTVDGKVFEDDYLFGAVSNSTSVAGLLTLPERIVSMNDGKFEVLLIRQPSSAGALTNILFSLASGNFDADGITFLSGSEITVESKQPVEWSLDGERCRTEGKVVIENLHNRLTLIR